MKRCPTCNRTFDEQWLAFCTEDGSTLLEISSAPSSSPEPPATVRIPAAQTNPAGQPPFDLPGSYNPPQPVAPAWRPPPPPPLRGGVPKQGLAVAALVLGIFSITFGWCCSIGLITSATGIVLGIASLVQIKNDPAGNTGKPLSIVGIVLGGAYLAFWIAFVMLYGAAIFMGSLGR